MKKVIGWGIFLFFFGMVVIPRGSQAVPSYARQVKKPCTACHTIWANLNQYGRQFKVKAYTDVSQDWEMINKDNMNLPVIAPFSTRVVLEPLVHDSQGNPPGSRDVNQVAIFMASRVFDYAGVFTSAEADGFGSSGGTFSIPTVKVAFQYPLGEGNTIGLVSFAGLASSADPFNTIGGRDRDLLFDEGTPFILNTGWTFNFWSASNLGEVLHGYFVGNRLYAAVGVLRGGDSSEGTIAGLTNNQKSDPNDMYYRLAWDQKLPNGAITFGALNYAGKQRILDPTGNPLYDSKVNRTYADVSLEQNYGEDHLFEVQALWGGGEDKNVFNDGTGARKYSGSYAQADYYYDRTVGVIAAVNNIKYKDVDANDDPNPIDKQNQWVVGFNYLPWLNTKVAIQHAVTETKFVQGGINSQANNTDRVNRVILDLLF